MLARGALEVAAAVGGRLSDVPELGLAKGASNGRVAAEPPPAARPVWETELTGACLAHEASRGCGAVEPLPPLAKKARCGGPGEADGAEGASGVRAAGGKVGKRRR